MNLDEYQNRLGGVVMNFHALESVLRIFLNNQDALMGPVAKRPDFAHMKVGQTVAVDAFTNYDSLEQLIRKFNKIVGPVDAKLCIDVGLVNLRDALAHGRVLAEVPRPPMRLVKFSKPDAATRTVRVTHAELLDEKWLKSATNRIGTAIMLVNESGRRTQKPEWWTTT